MSRNLSESIATMLETDTVTLHELLEARVYLEVPLAGFAARNATDETVRDLQAAIDAAEGNHPAAEAFRAADTRFHRIIAATAGNELLRAFTSWTLDVLQPSLIDTLGDAIDGGFDPGAAPRHPPRRPARAANSRVSGQCAVISSTCASSSQLRARMILGHGRTLTTASRAAGGL